MEHRQKQGNHPDYNERTDLLPSLCSLPTESAGVRQVRELCDLVRETAFAIHTYLGHGHLEKVYENALVHRLRKSGISVQRQGPIKVYDEDGTLLGDYLVDVLVEDWLIVELKAARALAPEHEAQVLGYLKASTLEHALLINFGSYKFEIRKFIWSPSRNGKSAA